MKLILFLCVLIICLEGNADPVNPSLRKQIKLKDGRYILAKVIGDEYGYCYYDDSHRIFYEKALNENFYEAVSYDNISFRQSSINRTRGTKSAVSTDMKPFNIHGYRGKKKGLLILVEFTDVHFTSGHNIAYYDRIINERNLQDLRFAGSVKDYFLEQSNGQFELEFDIVGPVKMPNSYTYYGNNKDKLDSNLGEMVMYACNCLNEDIDFSKYDWDNDGFVEQIGVVYSGFAESSTINANDIWPQKSELTNYFSSPFYLDGVCINTFFCSSEFRTENLESGIGTFCHEFSHCMGLPDTYNMSNPEMGTQKWDLMGNGVHNEDGFVPSGFTSLEKMLCGWQRPIELENDTIISGMAALSVGGEAYMITNKAFPQEFYLIENRQKNGFDKGLPGEGMLIYHIDYNPYFFSVNSVNTLNNGNTELRCDIIAANGDHNKNQQGCCFPTTSLNCFTNNSEPPSKLYHQNIDGTYNLSKPIIDIKSEKNLVSFCFKNDINDQKYNPNYDFHVDVAGTLSALIPIDNIYGIETMKISGNLNGSDFLTLRKMSGKDENGNNTAGILKDIDMSGILLSLGGDVYCENYTITDNTAFPNHGMYNTKLESVVLPNHIITIDKCAFEICKKLKKVTIVSDIKKIEQEAFYMCESLESIDLPSSLEYVGPWAFDKDNQLSEIHLYSTNPPKAFDTSFSEKCYKNATLYVPYGTVETYKAKTGWGNFVNIKEMPLKGDANKDGTVDVADVAEIECFIMGTLHENFDFESADINGDNTVNIVDLVLIINKIVKSER